MFKALMTTLTVLLGASAAQADYFYSPIGYYPGPVAVQPIYSAPIPVGYIEPVVVARPVYVSPVVHTVYSAPISTVTYSVPAPVIASPVYVRPVVSVAPVVVPGVVRESLIVRPYSSVYRSSAHGWGTGYSIYERNTPHRTVIRAHGW